VPRVQRQAVATWTGDVARGAGQLAAGTSGAFTGVPFSLPARIGDPGGKTSPEELLAAAHAGCFVMSLAGELASAGTPADGLEVTATVTLDEVQHGSHRIVSSELHARARVQGASSGDLERAAHAADEGCPFSSLVKASGTVAVKAELEGGTNGD
jgi:lipoyl-dependent peroxiredoxin